MEPFHHSTAEAAFGDGLQVLAHGAHVHALDELLFEVKPSDPATFALVAAMLANFLIESTVNLREFQAICSVYRTNLTTDFPFFDPQPFPGLYSPWRPLP